MSLVLCATMHRLWRPSRSLPVRRSKRPPGDRRPLRPTISFSAARCSSLQPLGLMQGRGLGKQTDVVDRQHLLSSPPNAVALAQFGHELPGPQALVLDSPLLLPSLEPLLDVGERSHR